MIACRLHLLKDRRHARGAVTVEAVEVLGIRSCQGTKLIMIAPSVTTPHSGDAAGIRSDPAKARLVGTDSRAARVSP